MKNLAISRRYAKALMLIGKDDGLAETYKEELNNFASLMINNDTLGQAICNPLYERSSRQKVLQVILEKLSLSKVMTSFLILLFEKGRIGYLDEIDRMYQKLADELKGVARASLTSATELSSQVVEKIRGSLSNMTGKEVILDVQQDQSLIGGIVTKIGDLVLDGSVKTQLLNMRESFKRGESV